MHHYLALQERNPVVHTGCARVNLGCCDVFESTCDEVLFGPCLKPNNLSKGSLMVQCRTRNMTSGVTELVIAQLWGM